MVVLGGVLSAVSPYILPRAQYELNQRALETAREGTEVKISAFQLDACVMGSVALILRAILDNPVVWQHEVAPISHLDEHSVFLARVL